MTPAQVSEAVERELAFVDDARVTALVRAGLVGPKPIELTWGYGDEVFTGWLVYRDEKSDTGIVFHEGGFAHATTLRWGLVFVDAVGATADMGMDCGWFRTFTLALLDGHPAATLDIWRVYRQDDIASYPGVPLTPEASWDATWAEVMLRRGGDPAGRYVCECDARARADVAP